jgi:hypothetical protein
MPDDAMEELVLFDLDGSLAASKSSIDTRLVTQQLVSTGEAVGKCDQPSMISSNAAILIVAKVEKVSEIA